MKEPKQLSLYIHIPFCIHKCGYCDFNSYAVDKLLNMGHVDENWATTYGTSLIREIECRAERLGLAGTAVDTVFFGGGTPSLFPEPETIRILETIQDTFKLSPEAEITLEANPGAAECERFEALRGAGFNRISIGMQSFNDEILSRLERVHTGNEAREAFHSTRRAGFSNVSLDLMFGTPFQSLAQATADVESALALGPEHISAYELTIEPGTNFGALHGRGELAGLPDEDTALEMWEMRDRLLSAAGYERYEISNFARKGFRCRHNLNYWLRGDYLGLGAGAHSLIAGKRIWNIARPDHYIESKDDPEVGGEDVTDPNKAIGEALMLGLRLKEGVSLGDIASRCGADPEEKFGEVFTELIDKKLLEHDNRTIRLTPRGTLLANQVLARFI
ncbi:MAG: radical SAM family heme chaperone HemW [Nitrospinaceae bacterium]|jgi:oxygen-independent coproporphyrinogen III oxidase|nr:radical SAM family heme chaperone HemW [Nitrospinaceae bacterium]MBT3434672.1 radical SAM family heme chaperone HemW [Nitrospinaceae bacterium]MBT3821366.1 radical SAM family heme chaperone HemW [Nitrospinaceae bacterium]MBT4095922.1 radical SAM family heme chaperone HemW [Nitrospinaceae bacterium]MBT4430082.1 radical SAM family heme chaperone HemW [Nitrospinaceae bacterium]